MKAITVILLAILGFNSLAHGNKGKRDVTSHSLKYEIDHGALNSCKLPSIKVRTCCNTMNASVPSYIVDTAAKQMNYIVDYMNTQTSKYTSACVTAARDIVCKGLLPQCSSDFRTLSFLSTSKSCQSINSCPTGLFTAIGRTSAALCSLSGKQYSLTTCVNPAITNINSVHCHALPNITVPSWIVPVLKAQGNAINAQRLAYSLVGVEQSCTSQWTNFYVALYFGWSKEECTSSLKCLPAILKTSTEDQFDCNIFPSKSDSAGLSSHFSLIAATWLLAVWISE